jgi:triacylglycerol lipase
LNETLRTFSVTTWHPVGWGIARVARRTEAFIEECKRRHPLRKGRQRKRAVDPAKMADVREAPVLLLHGIFHNATAFFAFERRLRREGFRSIDTIEFWTSLHSFQAMVDQLVAKVRALREECRARGRPDQRVRLVAHSLGGLVVRAALLDERFARNIDKVIFLGVPHQGNYSFRLPFPRCLRAIASHGPLMKRLKEEPLPGGIDYANLRGGLDFIAPRADTFLPHVSNFVFEDVGHAGLLSSRKVVQSVCSLLLS